MDKHLNRSIAQRSGDKEAIEKVGAPDPKMLEQLFGGTDEPALMKQAIVVASNPETTVENKIVALENFEMLIENLDNANNIENIKLWPQIVSFLNNPENEIRVLAALIVGIAVQNNPLAQKAYISHNGVKPLIDIALDSSTLKDLYFKALFALLSLIRNDEAAYQEFEKYHGWDLIVFGSADNDKKRLRLLSLLSAAILTGLKNKEQHIHKSVIANLIALLDTESHAGCVDKVLNIVLQLHGFGFQFEKEELVALEKGVKFAESREDVSQEEVAAAKKTLH